MDYKCVVAFLCYIHLSLAIHISTNTFPNSNEDESQSEESNEALQKIVVKPVPTVRSTSKYEVTEDIIDVPNTTPIPGANPTYAVNKPVNHANPMNEDGLSEEEKMYKQLEKNYYSILQILQAHHRDDDHEEMIDLPQFLNDFKDYLDGLKEGFIHGIHNIRRDVETEMDDSDIRHFFSEPISYIKKLFKRID